MRTADERLNWRTENRPACYERINKADAALRHEHGFDVGAMIFVGACFKPIASRQC